MAKSKNHAAILREVQQYVQQTHAKRLREEGFVSLDENDFRWVRVVNGEIFNSVCFFTRYTSIPVWLQIGFGMHPFFAEPYIPKHPYVSNLLQTEDIFSQQFLDNMGGHSFSVENYSPDIQINCLTPESRETQTFDRIIFSRLNQVKTIEECYSLYKQYYLNLTFYPIEQRFNFISTAFIDEAIYVDDREVYPYCIATVDEYLETYAYHLRREPTNKEYLKTYAILKRQKEVFSRGGREEYLVELKAREESIKTNFRKKWKLDF